MLPNLFMRLLGDNWKTSLSGILSFLMGTCGALTTILASTNGLHVSAKVFVVLTVLSGLSKAWLGMLMRDAK